MQEETKPESGTPEAIPEAEPNAKPDAKIKSKEPKSRKAKVAGILSCVLWVLGFALAFVIPPTSPFIWVPDTLLLTGFLPLLFIWRFSWPWILFGLFNCGIGFILLFIEYIPDSAFPAEIAKGKQHLVQYHNWMAWIIFAVLTFIYGVIRMGKNIVLWSIARSKAKAE
jgi:hypothetical protein